jgi:hypothetical protein
MPYAQHSITVARSPCQQTTSHAIKHQPTSPPLTFALLLGVKGLNLSPSPFLGYGSMLAPPNCLVIPFIHNQPTPHDKRSHNTMPQTPAMPQNTSQNLPPSPLPCCWVLLLPLAPWPLSPSPRQTWCCAAGDLQAAVDSRGKPLSEDVIEDKEVDEAAAVLASPTRVLQWGSTAFSHAETITAAARDCLGCDHAYWVSLTCGQHPTRLHALLAGLITAGMAFKFVPCLGCAGVRRSRSES